MGRIGNATPSYSNVNFTETKGQEAIDLYKSTTQTLMEWQELQINGIMAVDETGLWKYMRYAICVSRRNGKGVSLTGS